MKKTAAIVTATALISITALAGDALAGGRVAKRQVRQQARIAQGINSGELTGKEVRALERQQQRIQQSKRRAWADGRLTAAERARLERQQDRASARIYRFKHNAADRN